MAEYFHVNTNLQDFAKWLERQTQPLRLVQFPTVANGRIQLVPHPPSWVDDVLLFFLIDASVEPGHSAPPEIQAQQRGKQPKGFPVVGVVKGLIAFRVERLGTEQVEIIAAFDDDAWVPREIKDYYFQLLSEIEFSYKVSRELRPVPSAAALAAEAATSSGESLTISHPHSETGITTTAHHQPRPRERTRRRAEFFKKLKDASPGRSYVQVAQQANIDPDKPDEDKDITYNDGHVRNAYRAMGWKWERADRIR